MPRKYLMSWEGSPAYRWKKEFRKQIYRVSCRELGFPENSWTKDATYQAANDWWLKKFADLVKSPKWHPHQEVLDELKSKADVAAELGLHYEAEDLRSQIQTVEQLPAYDQPAFSGDAAQMINAAELFGISVPPDLDPTVAEMIFGKGRVWGDRKSRMAKAPVSSTAQHHADAFLEFNRDKAKSKVISTGRFGSIRSGIQNFLNWFGRLKALKEIMQADVSGYQSRVTE